MSWSCACLLRTNRRSSSSGSVVFCSASKAAIGEPTSALSLPATTSRAGVVSLDIRGSTKAGVRPAFTRDVLIVRRGTAVTDRGCRPLAYAPPALGREFAPSARLGCAKCEREPRGRRGSRAHGRLRRRRYPRILSVGSERPPQAAQMTKAGAGVVKAGARMRGNALARRRRSARSRRRRRRRPCLAGPTHRAGGKRS